MADEHKSQLSRFAQSVATAKFMQKVTGSFTPTTPQIAHSSVSAPLSPRSSVAQPASNKGGGGTVDGTLETITGAVNGVPATIQVYVSGEWEEV